MPPIEDPIVPINPNSLPDEVIEDAAPPAGVDADDAPPVASDDQPKSNLEALTEKLESLQQPDPNKPDTIVQDVKPDAVVEPDPNAPPPPESPDEWAARAERLYTIPSGLKGEHRKQYKELVDHAQEVERTLGAEREDIAALKAWNEDYRGVVNDCGANPLQLAMAFELIHAVNHGHLNEALAIIERERTNIARMVGKPLPGVDLLEGHDDLRDQVENLQITEEAAHEIARYRRQEQATTQHAERTRAEAEQEQRRQQIASEYAGKKQAAISAVNQWVAKLPSEDIDFPSKEAALREYLARPGTQQILQNLDPSLWPDHLREVYAAIRVQGSANVAPPKRGPQPLRPRGGGAGLTRSTPSSNREALDRALGYTAAG